MELSAAEEIFNDLPVYDEGDSIWFEPEANADPHAARGPP